MNRFRVRRLLTFIVLAIPAWSTSGQQWTSLTPLPDDYEEHALVYANGFLYNIGGSSGSNAEVDGTNVFFAQVYSNGTIGAWNHTTSLPESAFFHAAVAADEYIYVLGGLHYTPMKGDFYANTVHYAKITRDGSLGTWLTATPLPANYYALGGAAWNREIYITGGATDQQAGSTYVYSAIIQTNGGLSAWTAQSPLPYAVAGDVATANGMVYVLGGIVGGSYVQNGVWFSKIGSGGTLSEWNQTTLLAQPLVYFAGVAANGRIFTMGGDNGNELSNSYTASVGGDGTLGAWSAAPSLPQPLYLHAAAVSDSYIFVSGGQSDIAYSSAVYSMPLPSPPAAPALTGSVTKGVYQITLTSTTNTGFGIQASTNLTNWTNIGWGFTDTNGLLLFQDTNASIYSHRFYQAYWPLP